MDGLLDWLDQQKTVLDNEVAAAQGTQVQDQSWQNTQSWPGDQSWQGDQSWAGWGQTMAPPAMSPAAQMKAAPPAPPPQLPPVADCEMAAFCGECGFKFKSGARFCPKCGTKRG